MPTILPSVPCSQRPHLVLLWAFFKENCQENRTATLHQTNKKLSIQSGPMDRRTCRKAHKVWINTQWYSSTTLPQLPAQSEEATLLNFIIPIWFIPHLILFPFMCPDIFEHIWTFSLHRAPSQRISVQNYSANKGTLSSSCHLLDAFGTLLPRVPLLWKEKASLVLIPCLWGKDQNSETDLTAYNNKTSAGREGQWRMVFS